VTRAEDTLPLPPPRTIPRLLRWRVRLGGAGMLVGWGFLGAASLVFWTLGGRERVYAFVHLRGAVEHAEAQILSKGATNTEINGLRVFAYEYAFDVEGRTQRGAITTHMLAWEVDDRVPVDYASEDPARSLPAGLPRGPEPLAWLVVAVALLAMRSGAVASRDALERLHHGSAARGAEDERDGDFDEDRWIAFDAGGQRRRILTFQGKRMHPDPIVLYRPDVPGDGVALRDLPGAPDVDACGALHGDVAGLARYLLAPMLLVAYNLNEALAVVAG
jgi:hypothetical protein